MDKMLSRAPTVGFAATMTGAAPLGGLRSEPGQD